MQKIPYQFRYCDKKIDPELIQPENNCTPEELADGTLFNNYHLISQIGIQTTPGVRFRLNDSKNEIEIGDTGLYELDLTGKGNITKIQFNVNNKAWGAPGYKDYFFVLIDIMYENKDTYPLNGCCSLMDYDFILDGNSSNDKVIVDGGNSRGRSFK